MSLSHFSLVLCMTDSQENLVYLSNFSCKSHQLDFYTYFNIFTHQFQMTHIINKQVRSQAKHHPFVSWTHPWACLHSRKFSAAPLGVTDMLLKSLFVAMLDIDGGSVCLPSIFLPICQTYSLLEQKSVTQLQHWAPSGFGGKSMWWIPHTHTSDVSLARFPCIQQQMCGFWCWPHTT